MEFIVECFQVIYRSGRNRSIDESLLAWKDRLSFRQFNRNKRARFGIKLYECCESEIGYIYNLAVYTGNNKEKEVNKSIGVSGEVVKDVLGDLGKQGRSLFIDNWYTSPMLCKQLHDEKTNVCRTVKTNRKHCDALFGP